MLAAAATRDSRLAAHAAETAATARTMTTAAHDCRRLHNGWSAIDREAPAVRCVNAELVNASANAFALSKRSAGSFSSAFCTDAATFGGTDFRSLVTSCGVSEMIFMMICCAEEPMCGGFPVSIS